jgi:hypothetical protein
MVVLDTPTASGRVNSFLDTATLLQLSHQQPASLQRLLLAVSGHLLSFFALFAFGSEAANDL